MAVDLTNYELGVAELAEKLELPIPKENMEARKNLVIGMIENLCRQ